MDAFTKENTFPGNSLEHQWILDRLETLSAKEQYQLAAATISTGQLAELSKKKGDKLKLAVQELNAEMAKNAVNLLLALSDYEVICPAESYERLGEYYLRYEVGRPTLIPYANPEQIGRNYEDSHMGIFVGDCFVVLPGREPKQIYDGTNMDSLLETNWSLRLKLASPAVPDGVWVCLPDSAMDEEGRMDEIRLTLRELKVQTVQECRLLDMRCSLPELSVGLDEYQDLTDLIYDGNNLGYVLQEQGQWERHFLEKFRAALEYEHCHNLKLALDIAENLNCYGYCPASDVEQFGKEVLQRQGEAVFRDPVLIDGINLRAYGEAQLEQQGYLLNTAATGYIHRNGQEFHYAHTEPQPKWDITM